MNAFESIPVSAALCDRIKEALDEPDIRPLHPHLVIAMDLHEEIGDITTKLDQLIDDGWTAHEHGEPWPAKYSTQLNEIIAAYVDAVRRAGVDR